MTYTEALDYIHGLHRFGRKPELTRMNLLLEKLGNPQDQLQFVHVAGTNGKGSTCAMLSEIFRASGYKTGLYTSPFVLDFCERIRLDGEMIDREELATYTTEVMQAANAVAEEYDAPREFEFITAVAMLYYYRKKCDIVVLEVGLGGRYDATNSIKAPLAAVIAPIGYDHTQILGDQLWQIAGEKCGIIKKGSIVVTAPEQEQEALKVIRRTCKDVGCNLVEPQMPQVKVLDQGLWGSRFIYHGQEFTVCMLGNHQIRNAVTAIDTALSLVGSEFLLTPEHIAAGIANAKMPARLECIATQRPVILLDGAHNPHGIAALRDTLFSLNKLERDKQYSMKPKRILGVMGMLADKNCAQSLDIIAPYLHKLIVTTPTSPRALAAQELAELSKNYCKDIVIQENPQKAVQQALREDYDVIVIFGSLYFASEVRPLLI